MKPWARLPVLVWIHGGSFLNGGSSPPIFDGSALARQDLVVLALNYRLGRLGFFMHPARTRRAKLPATIAPSSCQAAAASTGSGRLPVARAERAEWPRTGVGHHRNRRRRAINNPLELRLFLRSAVECSACQAASLDEIPPNAPRTVLLSDRRHNFDSRRFVFEARIELEDHILTFRCAWKGRCGHCIL